MNDEKKKERQGGDLLSERQGPTQEAGAAYEEELERALLATEQAIQLLSQEKEDLSQQWSWQKASEILRKFRPVPWFIWRVSNFVFSKPGSQAIVADGLVFGLRRLMFAAASDSALGVGGKVNSMRRALDILPSDVIAAVSVIHAICRRLAQSPHERIWRPLLDDALIRARIGYDVGQFCPEFGSGRAMLAGFAGRCGLAILIAQGELEQARKALELLASGLEIREVGKAVYECDPLQASAMALSASGCGHEAAYGTVMYSVKHPESQVSNTEQLQWLAAFAITEQIRSGNSSEVSSRFMEALALDTEKLELIQTAAKKLVRRGHGWNWIL
jgi:hypothetical protein